jgi:hypothetical protein
MGQLPNHEVGRVWRRPTAHQLPQPFHLRRARWRRRAAVTAVPSPVALDGLPVCPALTMTRPVPFLLPVMVGPLLWSHLEQRRPAAEAVEPRPSASPARHHSLELGAAKARSLRFPSPPLVPHATGAPLSLLGTSAGALQHPRRVLGSHSPPTSRQLTVVLSPRRCRACMIPTWVRSTSPGSPADSNSRTASANWATASSDLPVRARLAARLRTTYPRSECERDGQQLRRPPRRVSAKARSRVTGSSGPPRVLAGFHLPRIRGRRSQF